MIIVYNKIPKRVTKGKFEIIYLTNIKVKKYNNKTKNIF